MVHDLDIDRIFAIIGIIFSSILIIYLSISGRLLYLIVGILTLISCVIWLLIRKNTSLKRLNLPQSSSIYLALNSGFFIFLALGILSIYLRPNLYERPLIYFIFISIMSGIVALEIVFSSQKQKHIGLILFQIIIIGLITAWSQLIIFPQVVGVDPWSHQLFTLNIIDTSHIPEDFSYSKLPVFHLIIASASLMTDLNYKFSTMFSVCMVQIICNAMFIFLLGKFIFDNFKVGLLGALLVITANLHIHMAFWTIPNSLAAVFIPIIIYLLFKLKKNIPTKATALSIFLMMALVLTHTITAMGMAIILFVLFAGFVIYNILYSKDAGIIPVTLGILIFFTTFMFAWWTYASGNIIDLANLIKWGFSADFGTPTKVLSYSAAVPFIEHLLSYLAEFVFFAVSIIGCFYMISKKGNRFSFMMCIAGVVIMAISFFAPLTGHWIIQDRWRYISMILLGIPAAVAILLVYRARNKNIATASYFLFIILLTFLMVTSPWANMDFLYPNTGYRSALTQSEFQAAQTVSVMWNKTMGVDKYYNKGSFMGYNTKDISNQLNDKDFTSSLVLIRDEIINKPFEMFRAVYKLDYDPRQTLDSQ
jgi:hypothetical protein